MKTKLIWGSLLGAIAIVLGALGAHALKSILTPPELDSFLTGARYQMYSALYILVLAAIDEKINVKLPFYLAIIGTLCFSVSIYLLVADNYLGISLNFLGPITPIGGLLLIGSWVSLAISAIQSK